MIRNHEALVYVTNSVLGLKNYRNCEGGNEVGWYICLLYNLFKRSLSDSLFSSPLPIRTPVYMQLNCNSKFYF